MASNWDTNWEDEEWLKRQNAATLHSIFKEAGAQGKDQTKIKKVVVEKLHAVTDFKEVNSYDLLAFLKVADDADLTVTGADNRSRDLKAEMDDVIEKRTADLGNKTDLISRLNRKALLEAAKITKAADANAVATLNGEIASTVPDITSSLNGAQEISDAEFDNFDNADKAGALDDVADSVKKAFIQKLAELSGWEKTEGRIIEKNDNALLNAVTTLDVYKDDGSLNDVYADCAELADKLTFEYPENVSDAQKAELAKAYKQQLLANAAMRATNEILKDRSFILRHKTAEDILTAYKSEVAKQFERGVVVAGLATHQATGIMLDKITRNKDTGKIEYDGGADDAVTQAIADILEGNAPINPLTVQMDTYQLDIENRKVERIAKQKKISKKLGFWNRAKNVWAAAKDNIIKKGGWKKMVVNGVVFAGAAAAMVSGSGFVIGAGAAVYAGWTAVNAWLTPAYDSLNNEMYEGKVKGLKARIAYIKQNFSRAFKAKRAEPGFKSRAWWRTAEGVVVGGLTGGMGFFGITGWTKIYSRQGTMAAGKTGSLIRSLFARKKAKKNMETTYSMDNFKALQTAEGYLKQDVVALGAVIGGALLSDSIKAYAESGAEQALADHVQQQVAGQIDTPVVPVTQAGEQLDSVPGYQPFKFSTFDPMGGAFKKMMDESKALVEEAGKLSDTEVADLVAGAKEHNLLPADAEVIVDGQKVPVSGLTPEQLKALPADEQRLLLVNSVSRNHALDSIEALKENVSPVEETADNASPTAYQGETELNSHGPYRLEEVKFEEYENLKPYNKAEMGITFGSYKTLIRIYGAEELDRMLGALNREGVMDNFKDMGLTKEQLLVRFRGLDATTDRVGRDGFSIQGAVRYHHEEAMTYLNKLLGPCGDQVTPAQYAVIKQSLAVMDNQGGYHGEGFVPTSSVHIRAHGYNTDDCGKGEYNQFKVGGRIHVQPQPVHTEPVTVPEQPENPELPITPQDFSVNGGTVDGFVDNSPEIKTLKIDFAEAKSAPVKATAVYANSSQDYPVDAPVSTKDSVVDVTKDGINIYHKDLPEFAEGQTTQNREVIYAFAGDYVVPQGHAQISAENGIITFEFGEKLKVVVDPERKTHVLLDGKEKFLTPEAAVAWRQKLGAELAGHPNLARAYAIEGVDESANANSHIEAVLKKNTLKDVTNDVNTDIKSASTYTETTTSIKVQALGRQSVVITPEQNAALLSDNARIISRGEVENGQMIFEVQGVEGVDRLAMPVLRPLSVAEGQQASVVMDPSKMGSTDALHRSIVRVPASDGHNYTVEINTRGGAAQVLDENGKRVFLDKQSSAAIGTACQDALKASGVKGVGNINLNPYPDGSLGAKCAEIYNVVVTGKRQTQAILGSIHSK